MTQFRGQCHCGNISFSFRTEKTTTELSPRLCQCSFCIKHGGRWISDPDGSLDVSISARSQISPYRFGHRTAEYLACTTCGVTPLVTSTIDGKRYAVVNANAFDDHTAFNGPPGEFDYDREDTSDRLARRTKNWIGSVTFEGL